MKRREEIKRKKKDATKLDQLASFHCVHRLSIEKFANFPARAPTTTEFDCDKDAIWNVERYCYTRSCNEREDNYTIWNKFIKSWVHRKTWYETLSWEFYAFKTKSYYNLFKLLIEEVSVIEPLQKRPNNHYRIKRRMKLAHISWGKFGQKQTRAEKHWLVVLGRGHAFFYSALLPLSLLGRMTITQKGITWQKYSSPHQRSIARGRSCNFCSWNDSNGLCGC